MIDAITKINTKSNRETLEVYSPKFRHARPIMVLDGAYKDRPVKLISGWEDVGHKKKDVSINGMVVSEDKMSSITLVRGMYLELKDDDNVYVIVPKVLM